MTTISIVESPHAPKQGEFSAQYGQTRVCKLCGVGKPLLNKFFYYENRPHGVLSKVCRACAQTKAAEAVLKAATAQEPLTEIRCRFCGGVFPKTHEHFNYRNEALGYFDTCCRNCRTKRQQGLRREEAQALPARTDIAAAVFSLQADVGTLRVEMSSLQSTDRLNRDAHRVHMQRLDDLESGQRSAADEATALARQYEDLLKSVTLLLASAPAAVAEPIQPQRQAEDIDDAMLALALFVEARGVVNDLVVALSQLVQSDRAAIVLGVLAPDAFSAASSILSRASIWLAEHPEEGGE